MSDDTIVTLRPWRNQAPGELRTVEKVETVRETLAEGYDERLARLEAQMEALEIAGRNIENRLRPVEERPHLTQADLNNIGAAADDRAKRAIEAQIMPMIEALRDQVEASKAIPKGSSVAAPRNDQLSDIIVQMLPVVKGLETEGQRLTEAQSSIIAEMEKIQLGMQKLQEDQLNLVVASVRDQRMLIKQTAATMKIGNDG